MTNISPSSPAFTLSLEEVARLEETRQARGLEEITDEHITIAGGVASRGEPGLSVNNSNALGLQGPVTPDDIARLCAFHEERGSEPRTEACPFADPSLLAALETHCFVHRGWELTFFRELHAAHPAASPFPAPAGLTMRVVDPADACDVRRYSEVVMSGFFPEGESPSEDDFALSARVVAHPRTVCLAAYLDGQMVGGGGMGVSGKIAGLFGLTVLPAFRKQGIQLALMAARLNEAARRGVIVATIASRPGIGTERNARRLGFQLAYSKAIMCRPGPGLIAARG